MNETLELVGSGIGGAILGAIFFGGLWWTIRKGVLSAHPAPWFLGSLLVRMSVVLVGFYFVGHGYWDRLTACLVGFVIARFIVTYQTRPPLQNRLSPEREDSHAS